MLIRRARKRILPAAKDPITVITRVRNKEVLVLTKLGIDFRDDKSAYIPGNIIITKKQVLLTTVESCKYLKEDGFIKRPGMVRW